MELLSVPEGNPETLDYALPSWKAGQEFPAHTEALLGDCLKALTPPKDLLISEWADANMVLPDTSPEPGPWRTDRAPYLKRALDALTDPSVRKLVLVWASQTAKTSVMLCINGYHAHHDPLPTMIIYPSEKEAGRFSKARLTKMYDKIPDLADKLVDGGGKSSSNTILYKEFPGWFVVLVGANVARDLASWPIGLLQADEIDGFPVTVEEEGDPLTIAEKRVSNFPDHKIVYSSTPKVKGESVSEVEYENSTMEEWQVECPSCHELQKYDFWRLQFASLEMCCEHCGCLHGQYEWQAQPGEWVAEKEHATTVGLRLPGMASPWVQWATLVEEFQKAGKDPAKLQVFYNTRLAEWWELKGDSVDEELLKGRRHYYNCDVPKSVRYITAGVDVHPDRIEAGLVGWGEGEEAWHLIYRVLPGDPLKSGVWGDLDDLLLRGYKRADGAVMGVCCTAIDSGHATDEVYDFCKKRLHRAVFAVKGDGGPGKPIVKFSKSKVGKKKDCHLVMIGTDAAKDVILSRLSIDTEGPGYCHFPREAEMGDGEQRGYDEEYFRGLLSEHRVPKKHFARIWHVWEKRKVHGRNEPLDCFGYAIGARRIRPLDLSRDPFAARSGERRVESGKPGRVGARRRGRRVLSSGVQV